MQQVLSLIFQLLFPVHDVIFPLPPTTPPEPPLPWRRPPLSAPHPGGKQASSLMLLLTLVMALFLLGPITKKIKNK